MNFFRHELPRWVFWQFSIKSYYEKWHYYKNYNWNVAPWGVHFFLMITGGQLKTFWFLLGLVGINGDRILHISLEILSNIRIKKVYQYIFLLFHWCFDNICAIFFQRLKIYYKWRCICETTRFCYSKQLKFQPSVWTFTNVFRYQVNQHLII